MSDADQPVARPEPSFDQRRLRFNDIRDDYDDEFGRAQSPREVARRALRVPAIGLIAVGTVGIIGMVVLCIGLLIDYLPEALDDEDAAIDFVSAEICALFGVGLFVFVVLGGVSMLQLRRRWVALYSAYIVAGLSLAGFYAILLFPFGFWGLIVLYRPDVWNEFPKPPWKVRND